MLYVQLYWLILVLNQERIYENKGEFIYYSTDKEFLDAHESVFVGKIIMEVETNQYNGFGIDIPFTFYEVETLDHIKGNGDKQECICFYGGKVYLNTWELYTENNEIPQVNQYYLIFTNRTSGTNVRIKENDYIIAQNQQKILLQNYDGSKELNEQSDSILQIISKYKKMN
ncbi:MAG: hypothetical protein K2N64_05745 [Anaeroplasmataceae bacterium]|nr:hypothetical protein [Anaeroplasmataceae bacterium]